METAESPSAAAIPTAASTMRSSVRPGFGPLTGRSRSPHAASMLAGRPVPPDALLFSVTRSPAFPR
jgi:hypothetical protein